ncbi:MAG: TonB-dependent receptor, partial [Bacteroidota bacterium]
MSRSFRVLLFFFFLPVILLAQNRFTLSGTVSEAASNETLIGVSIVIPSVEVGTSTNEYGFYSISLPAGRYQVLISHLGYQEIRQELDLRQDQKIDFKLVPQAQQLSEVVVSEDVEKLDIRKAQMSVNGLNIKTIKQIPVILGEADVVKSLLLLPGVTNAGEASSGFNVRGGAVDQNLILLDEATIFNSSHLFGFFSVFNPDAIKDVKLFKGGIPARYGGRVSSVLEMFQREGNNKNVKVTGGIGAVASRLLIEGPLVKNRSAFLAGGRASYSHFFLPLFDIENKAYFYDINTKVSHRFNEKNSIYLSGYFGRDLLSLNDNFVNTYGNTVANFRWNHLFSDQLFSNLSLIYSNYFYGLDLDFADFSWDSAIENFNLKYDLKHYLNEKLQINYGLNNIYYVFNPGTIEPTKENSGIQEDQLAKKYANEVALYVDVEQQLTRKLTVNYGLRGSGFYRLGQDDLFIYRNDQPILFDPFQLVYTEATPIDTISTDRSTNLATFFNLEPRLSLAYALNDNQSLKVSYTRLAQYLHLLSNTSSPTPLDVWTPSGPFVEPQLLDQFALGYYRKIKGGAYALEVEGFYKNIQNRIDYIDGADLIANEAIEQVVLNGMARAYGFELLLRKTKGRLQAWLAYTLSRSEQRTPGRPPVVDNGRSNLETGINFGEWYSTPYDKTHDISLFGSYELTDRWSLNANFIFQTGQPTNFPVGQFEFQGIIIPFFGRRNQTRLPDYHRVDISATFKNKQKEGRNFQSEWVFSIYNVYNRMNA